MHPWLSINEPLTRTLNQHSKDTMYNVQCTLSFHLIDAYESMADWRPSVNRVSIEMSIECRLRLSTKYRSGCQLRVEGDVDQVSISADQSRVSINT